MHDKNYLLSLWKSVENNSRLFKALRRGELFQYSDSEQKLKQEVVMYMQ